MLICVILAGGRGTRLIPLTDTTPKPLLKAGGKTLLEWNMDNVVNSVDKFVIVISYLGDQIIEQIGDNYKGKPVEYVWQTNPKGGTLDAFRTAIFEKNGKQNENPNSENPENTPENTGSNLINSRENSTANSMGNSASNSVSTNEKSSDSLDNYLVIHADDVHAQATFDNLFAEIKKNPKECYLSAKVLQNSQDGINFGMFEIEDNYQFIRIVEKPDYFVSNLANIAISYFPNKVLEFVSREIVNLPIGQKEAYITDLFNDYSAKYPIKVVPTIGMWLPVTSIADLEKTDKILSQNSPCQGG